MTAIATSQGLPPPEAVPLSAGCGVIAFCPSLNPRTHVRMRRRALRFQVCSRLVLFDSGWGWAWLENRPCQLRLPVARPHLVRGTSPHSAVCSYLVAKPKAPFAQVMTTAVPALGSTASCSSPCLLKKQFVLVVIFPPRGQRFRRVQSPSHWREFSFALHQIQNAIKPHLDLRKTLSLFLFGMKSHGLLRNVRAPACRE